jgi:hypothetical protein
MDKSYGVLIWNGPYHAPSTLGNRYDTLEEAIVAVHAYLRSGQISDCLVEFQVGVTNGAAIWRAAVIDRAGRVRCHHVPDA